MSPPPTCAEVCPVVPGVTCILEPGNHQDHFGRNGDEFWTWENTGYIPPPPEDALMQALTGPAATKAFLTNMARRLREAQ
jgi:hypothetical protein